jgi:hypothetical protein
MALDPKVGGVLSELSLASTICPTTSEGQADLATSDLRGYIQRAYLNGRPTEERLGQAQGVHQVALANREWRAGVNNNA